MNETLHGIRAQPGGIVDESRRVKCWVSSRWCCGRGGNDNGSVNDSSKGEGASRADKNFGEVRE